MKASKFTDAQKAFILKQGADGVPVADICRKAGISQATYFNWKKKFEGLTPPEIRRLKQLEDENAKLRKLVANLVGPGDAPGCHSPKNLRPDRKCKLDGNGSERSRITVSEGDPACSASTRHPRVLRKHPLTKGDGLRVRLGPHEDRRPFRVRWI